MERLIRIAHPQTPRSGAGQLIGLARVREGGRKVAVGGGVEPSHRGIVCRLEPHQPAAGRWHPDGAAPVRRVRDPRHPVAYRRSGPARGAASHHRRADRVDRGLLPDGLGIGAGAILRARAGPNQACARREQVFHRGIAVRGAEALTRVAHRHPLARDLLGVLDQQLLPAEVGGPTRGIDVRAVVDPRHPQLRGRKSSLLAHCREPLGEGIGGGAELCHRARLPAGPARAGDAAH